MNNFKDQLLKQNQPTKKKYIFSTTWGANNETIRKFYDIYEKKEIEYGISIFSMAKNT